MCVRLALDFLNSAQTFRLRAVVCLALAKESEGAACCTSLNSSQSEPMCSCSPQTELTVKQKVGLEMLSEAREGEFSAAFGILVKVLGNIVATPDEPKYRKLRTSNDKIKSLLATKGVR